MAGASSKMSKLATKFELGSLALTENYLHISNATNDPNIPLDISTSSHFRCNCDLQFPRVDELLAQLRPDYGKQLSFVDQHLRRLKSIIEEIPGISGKSITEAEIYLRQRAGVTIPFPKPGPRDDVKYVLEYARPTNINVVGSFALKTAAKDLKNATVDLAVTIPKAIIQKKDYLDYRYLYKRAYYIACIATGIKISNEAGFNISYAYQDDDRLRPIVLVQLMEPGGDPSHPKVIVRILTAIEDGTFPMIQTMPTKDTLRQIIFNESKLGLSNESLWFTFFYNSALRSESCITAYLKVLHGAATKCPAFRDACILGRTWLCQRGFGTSIVQGGFGHFEWSVLLALLLETGRPNGKPLLSMSYSSYQIFKAMVQFLSERDLTTPVVLFNAEVPHNMSSGTNPILFDGKRGMNICFKMTSWSYQLLRHESITTLRMLNDTDSDHFDNIFIHQVELPLCRFDECLKLSPRPNKWNAFDNFSYFRSIHDVLTKALGNRIKLIYIFCDGILPWSVHSSADDNDGINQLNVGLLFCPKNRYRIVDRGPVAENKGASNDFRNFWGPKAELRRFKDGTIAESIVWSEQQSDGSIMRQIITHALYRHFDLGSDDICFRGLNFEESPNIRDITQPTASFQPVLDAFESLESYENIIPNKDRRVIGT
ncbi:predicted protein [Uncinocarpus reesii 1704]|uniref:U3 small nucleolar RNA-associated protein 22 n=1 Tax=Uncinocarpus reesii (strain UAMH 1704) TaxID=336963 RepID=C4JWP4_UNCRE|nr:uncharacterized protein UREG_06986 [Uncinocarpus reesii 1704]EEP82121.1 predicted protein [Uncinocarpus reesii 1704]